MAHPVIFDGNNHREMNDAEYADWQTYCADLAMRAEAALEQAAAQAAAAASGRAKLAALGLTDAEIAALLGA
ncbi:MAG: hypothetical protein FJ211_10450 [Ignavibacteria bacterium]|nr:hypothetical protein [Ignavibacteria bacterium]